MRTRPSEVSRISSSVVDQLVAETLDDATRQALIEDFIQKVGAGSEAARIEVARALFEIARAEGNLDEVEDELFRFARSYESSDTLVPHSPMTWCRPIVVKAS